MYECEYVLVVVINGIMSCKSRIMACMSFMSCMRSRTYVGMYVLMHVFEGVMWACVCVYFLHLCYAYLERSIHNMCCSVEVCSLHEITFSYS